MGSVYNHIHDSSRNYPIRVRHTHQATLEPNNTAILFRTQRCQYFESICNLFIVELWVDDRAETRVAGYCLCSIVAQPQSANVNTIRKGVAIRQFGSHF